MTKEVEYIENRVHELYWKEDVNCARTTMIILSELLKVDLESQTLNAALGMHGAGGYRAQCGLVEGALMFLGIYGKILGYSDSDVVSTCFEYSKAFEAKFGSLRCLELRPNGFQKDDSPHLCEELTCNAICFTYNYLKKRSKNMISMY